MRKLKSGQRPVEEDTARIISPCDAKLTVCPITEYGIMKIKHTPYTVKELLKVKNWLVPMKAAMDSFTA